MINFLRTPDARAHLVLRKLPAALSFLTALGFGSYAMAGADTDCVIQLSQPLIDYGQVNRTQLFPGGVAVRDALLGKSTLSLSAVCDSKTTMALQFRGEPAGSDSYRFARTGAFTLKVLSAQLDGKPVRMRPAQSVTANANGQMIRPGESLAPYDGVQALAGERLSMLIEVQTRIDSAAASVRNDEVWAGNGQFELQTF
ncbi:hypothetical protein [Pseudomonas sp. UC 17F4]|uniref:hypothetical protein n=1 Tax=Pseudomonas sp. UC 17F4 TaxID=1855328 RepID=UPI000B861F72|nr:hypothetical protein [Pseudomonas sp. UC 17F4]